MPVQHLVPAGEGSGQPFGQINRPMLSTGTADRHRQVVTVVACIVGQPARHEVVDVPVHALNLRLALQVGHDHRIATIERRERGLVMRIGQAPHVEHEVSVERNTMLVSE